MLNTLFAAGLAGLFYCLCGTNGLAHRVLSWSPLRGLGVVSYGFYLWHVPAMMAIRQFVDPDLMPWLRQSAALALSVGLALVSWLAVERPVQRWIQAHSLKRSP